MKRAFIVGVALLFTSPVFGELSPMFEHGLVPVDGYHDSAATSGYRFRPNLKDGQRLSGVVTINPLPYAPAGVTYRLLVDGIPQRSSTIDTRNWSDGTHVIAFQVMDPTGLTVHNGSQVAVFNNMGIPFTDIEGQAIVGDIWHGTPPNSLAWGRVDVLPPYTVTATDSAGVSVTLEIDR